MPDIFDDLKRINDQAWRVGKRLSKDDPLGPHDVADRLDRAALRVWNIIAAAEQAGPEFAAEVIRSRYFAGSLPELRKAIDRFLSASGYSGGSYVAEGWWHPNVKSGQVHDHPERPGASWSIASHRLCEPVYTKRIPSPDGAAAPPSP